MAIIKSVKERPYWNLLVVLGWYVIQLPGVYFLSVGRPMGLSTQAVWGWAALAVFETVATLAIVSKLLRNHLTTRGVRVPNVAHVGLIYGWWVGSVFAIDFYRRKVQLIVFGAGYGKQDFIPLMSKFDKVVNEELTVGVVLSLCLAAILVYVRRQKSPERHPHRLA